MVRPEQKISCPMKNIVMMPGRAGQVIVDSCTGMFRPAEACTVWWTPHRFIEYKFDPLLSNAPIPGVVDTYARQVLNGESDITVSAEVMEMK